MNTRNFEKTSLTQSQKQEQNLYRGAKSKKQNKHNRSNRKRQDY